MQFFALYEALPESLFQNFSGQFHADKYHFADARLVLAPFGAQVAAHEFVYALEDDFAVCALHVEYAFVAVHFCAVNSDDCAQKVFEFGGVKGAVGAKDEAFYVVVLHMVLLA